MTGEGQRASSARPPFPPNTPPPPPPCGVVLPVGGLCDQLFPATCRVHGVPHPKQSPEVVVTATVVEEKAAALAPVKEMRKERIRTEGLVASRPEGQRMADIMKWG